MADIVEAIASFDAEPALVGRSIAPRDVLDLVVFDVISQQAADATIRADRIHFLINRVEADISRRHQRAGRTGLHTLSTADTGTGSHVVTQIKHDLSMRAAERQADHIVVLLLATGPNTTGALDTALHIDRDRRMREIPGGLVAPPKPALLKLIVIAPMVQF